MTITVEDLQMKTVKRVGQNTWKCGRDTACGHVFRKSHKMRFPQKLTNCSASVPIKLWTCFCGTQEGFHALMTVSLAPPSRKKNEKGFAFSGGFRPGGSGRPRGNCLAPRWGIQATNGKWREKRPPIEHIHSTNGAPRKFLFLGLSPPRNCLL